MHGDLVRSVALGDDFVMSGSYDLTIKVSTLSISHADFSNLPPSRSGTERLVPWWLISPEDIPGGYSASVLTARRFATFICYVYVY